jgi:quinohemoprotein amine dehydrogenase
MQGLKFTTKILFLVISSTGLMFAQDGAAEGIPITDPLTIAKCGGCHQQNPNTKMMRRLSYERTTPEVWEQNIKRMVRLNGVSLSASDAGQILRYLSDNNGLAPEEARPIFWEAEHRLFRDQEGEDDQVPAPLERTCNYCHEIGRVLGQRRTRDDYQKLANLHMGLFPGSETAVFRPHGGTPLDQPVTEVQNGTFRATLLYPPAPVKEGSKYPIDIALDYLAKNQPLITPEWTAWKAVMRPPKLAGVWAVNAYEKGKGRVYGTMTIEPGSAPDLFTTKIEMRYATSGLTISRTGKGIVYTGYSWRGRSATTGAASDPSLPPAESREAMFVSRDNNEMTGRWFWGGYQEFGIDVHLVRVGAQPVVFGTDRYALKTPSTDEVHIFGANLPASPKTSDIDLGPGVTVTKVISGSPTEIAVEVSVMTDVPVGMHDVSIAGATAEKTLAVYDKVSYIKVTPDASFARLGGTIVAKQYAQFEAIAYADGPDGKPGTADDIALGPVSANWGLEEFMSTPDDDDVKYVGTINDTGLFTPSGEGPNPKRKKQANNYPTDNWGDVWVDASYKPESGPALKARSYLVVTVPTYIHYDQPEVDQ